MRLTPIAAGAFLAACGLDVVGIAPLPIDTGTDGGPPRGTTDGAATSDVLGPGPSVTLTVDPAPNNGITVASDVGGIACPGTCSATLPAGTIVTLTANLGDGFSLTGWSEPSCGREPTCKLTLDGARTVTFTSATHVDYIQSTTKLYTIATSTTAGPDFANCGGSVLDLAIDRKGATYAIRGNPTILYALDVTSGACTQKGDSGENLNSLTFAPDPKDPTKDILLAADNASATLYQLDPQTAAVMLSFSMGEGNIASGDLAWLPGSGLYVTLRGGLKDRLGRIDVAEKKLTIVGDLPQTGFFALGWRGKRLLGYANTGAYFIDPTTAATTDLNIATGVIINGATSGP